jgi:hypothetical protein
MASKRIEMPKSRHKLVADAIRQIGATEVTYYRQPKVKTRGRRLIDGTPATVCPFVNWRGTRTPVGAATPKKSNQISSRRCGRRRSYMRVRLLKRHPDIRKGHPGNPAISQRLARIEGQVEFGGKIRGA